MRLFVAVDLPGPIRAALAEQQKSFRDSLGKAGLGARWVNPAGIHLTLKFLGHVQDERLNEISQALARLGGFTPFQVEVKGFGCFPTPNRPRVLWAGLEAPPDLARLASKVEESMEKLGFEREQREFNPHLTLARFKEPRPLPALRELVEVRSDVPLGRFEICDYFLFESKLHPGGAEYRKLAQFPK